MPMEPRYNYYTCHRQCYRETISSSWGQSQGPLVFRNSTVFHCLTTKRKINRTNYGADLEFFYCTIWRTISPKMQFDLQRLQNGITLPWIVFKMYIVRGFWIWTHVNKCIFRQYVLLSFQRGHDHYQQPIIGFISLLVIDSIMKWSISLERNSKTYSG